MRVAKLMKKLSKMPADAKVVFLEHPTSWYDVVDEVTLHAGRVVLSP